MIARTPEEAGVVLAALALFVRTYNPTATPGVAREAVETAMEMLLRHPGGERLLERTTS